jgi:integrase
MPKLYTRNQGGTARYYADLRDIGGGQVALRPSGSTRATTDESEALKLLGRRIQELEAEPPSVNSGILGPLVEDFLLQNPGEVTERWLEDTALRLKRACEQFGKERDLVSIEPRDIREWLNTGLVHLAGSTQRHYLHALSGLYRYAQELGLVPVGFNPVSGLYRKPKATRDRQRTDEFFEIDAAARFLDAARRHGKYFEVIATYLLTGGRRTEVFGLLNQDLDFDSGYIHFRPNQFRGLKRTWSERSVPMWPQLRQILEPYVEAHDAGNDDLVFPGETGKMITDLRKPIREIAKLAKLAEPRLTKFRHTYASARLQTTDNGRQIALWTVAKELGHKTVARVEDTYGHPSHYRPRGEAVEYRER